MFVVFVIIVFLSVLVFIPIRIKLHISYKEKKLHLYFFNIDILNKLTLNKRDFNIASNKSNRNLSATIEKLRVFLRLTQKIRSKPKIDIKINLSYGLDDAAYTAILYGIINSIIPAVFLLSSKLFTLNRHEINIKPYFNKFYFELEINSIIHVSFAKIIYIILSLYIGNKSLKKRLRTSVNKI